MTAIPTTPTADVPRIDQVPVGPSALKSWVVTLATAMIGVFGLGLWFYGTQALQTIFETNAAAEIHLKGQQAGGTNYVRLFEWLFRFFALKVGGLCLVIALISIARTKLTLIMLRGALCFVYPGVLAYAVLVWLAIFSLIRAGVTIDGAVQDRATGVLMWWSMSWPVLAIGLCTIWLHVMLASRPVISAFTKQPGPAMYGDRVLEDWRTHGRDPRARKSFFGSFTTHFVILILIPFILQDRGCVEAYRVPQGSGNPVVALVKVVKPKKKKKKTLTLRPNSAILFDIPDLDNLEVDKQMEEMTQARYEASNQAKSGKMGKGGGKTGGWPEGMENYKVRFIRLEHGGKGWDDGMNQTDADINFLRHFAQATGFKKIANKGESHSIALLDKYPDDGFPPFVFLTGDHHMGRTSSRDHKVLREYCLKGGMLIADAGSAEFHRSFEQLMRQVFPDKQLLDIADDDMLYQLPYGFPNGAPAFWHHGGRRAKGIKHEGRWVVFYHPGDMNDAWKSPGYSDVTPEMKDAALNLGVNLVYYAFNQWNDAVAKERK